MNRYETDRIIRHLIDIAGQVALGQAVAEFQLPNHVADWVLFNPKYFEVAFNIWYTELG